LLYILEVKSIEQNILKQAIRFGQPIPERIINAPELRLGLRLYFNAFFDLDAERSHALALTPIPWTSIMHYARAYELDEEQTEDLVYFIRYMDNVNLDRLRKKNPSPSKAKRK
jgi:hypothetical protein